MQKAFKYFTLSEAENSYSEFPSAIAYAILSMKQTNADETEFERFKKLLDEDELEKTYVAFDN